MESKTEQHTERDLSPNSVVAESFFACDNVDMKTRADRIRYLRTEILGNLSQVELSLKLGLSRGAIGNWELGGGVKAQNLAKLAAAAGTTVDWIERNVGEPPAPRSAPFDTSWKKKVIVPSSGDSACMEAVIDGMIGALGFQDSRAQALKKVLRKVLVAPVAGDTEAETLAARRTLAHYAVREFLDEENQQH